MSVIPIMYHQVMDPCDKFPSVKSLSPKQFKEQLDFFESKGNFISLDQFVDIGRKLRKNDCNFILTFDHGTKDHIEIVLPELLKRGIKGYFFIMTSVPEKGTIPSIDKQRYVESSFIDYRDFYGIFYDFCKENNISSIEKIEPSRKNLTNAKNYLKRFKFYSNHERLFRLVRDQIIPFMVFNEIFEKLFREIFGSDHKFIEENYLLWEDILLLEDCGMNIGTHGHDHIFYSETNFSESINDIRISVDILRKHLHNNSCNAISYPNGIFCDKLIPFLNSIRIKWGFGTHTNIKSPFIEKYNIGRIDTKQCLSEI